MMKSPHIVALAATLLLPSAAFAATGDFSKIDANGDGKLTLEEGLKLHPEWTESAFKVLDTNADGVLNELEYETAVTAAPVANDPAAAATEPSSFFEKRPRNCRSRGMGPVGFGMGLGSGTGRGLGCGTGLGRGLVAI
jgi:hypothetical protein